MKALETPAMAMLDALADIDAAKVLVVAVEGEDEHAIAFVYACRESPLADILTATIRRAEADYEEMGDRTPNPYDLLDLIAQVIKCERDTIIPMTYALNEIAEILKGNADGLYTYTDCTA